MRRLRLFLSILCLIPIASCTPVSSCRDWTVADLRLLDPLDAPTPATDILGVYTRTVGSDLEIRIDLLDITFANDYVIEISLVDDGTFVAKPLNISIPAQGKPVANTGVPLRVVRDPWLDTVTLRLNRKYISSRYRFKVSTYPPLSGQLADETSSVSSDALPPTQRAPLALIFWDVFPAATPAQALRRWDGAHTGPRGERHGLKYILDNAGLYGIPVALLDLKTPASLAALDYMGVTPQIQELANRALLLLPDVAYAEPAEASLDFSRRAAIGFGLPASLFVYNASSRFQSNYLAQFYPRDEASHLSHSGGTRLIPLPAEDAIQAATDGPSLIVRQALMDAALSTDPSDLVVLGGDLPHSTWGNENIAGPAFAWIAAHPWIQVLTGDDLLSFPVETSVTLPKAAASASPILETLRAAPNNAVTDSAWQTYFTLTSPTADEQLQTLRHNYFGQISELLAAARWVEHPTAQANCDHDLNNDGQPECGLSNQEFFAILDPIGGRLTNLFYLDGTGPHQLIGPSSQFTVGLSDPSEWKPELGEAADPSVIPGAFSDDSATWMVFRPAITTDRITFTSPEDGRIKTYWLLQDGIEITYQGIDPVSTRIPLAVDPQAFYFSPSKLTGRLAPGMWTWRLVDGIRVKIRTDMALSVQSFTDSFAYLSQPEDPDRAYPGGHYLPFPLSIITLQGSGNFTVNITVK